MIMGRAIKYGDNIDTDVIIPARYLNCSDPNDLAQHCMEDLDKEFVNKVQKGSVLVAGKNFGCGSSREHAPLVIKASGVSCIIAESFARIFYRNAINIGLPIVECEKAALDAEDGDMLSVDIETGTVYNVTMGVEYKAAPFPEFVQGIMKVEGLVNYIRNEVTQNV